jgi:hypothetical protein
MSHLQRSAGRFFAFHLINYTTFLAMQGFFRTVGLFFSNYYSAFRVAVCIFPNLVLYAGYMMPINQMKRWLFWIVSQLPGMGVPFQAYHVTPVLHQSGKLWMVSANGE